MTPKLAGIASRRPLIAAAVVACLLVALALGASQLLDGLRYVRLSTAAARVAAARDPRSAPLARTLAFRFRGTTRFARVTVDAGEVRAARGVDIEDVFGGTKPLRALQVRSLIRSQARSSAVGSLADQLRAMRDQLGLGSDEYVELMAAAVQEIPYGTVDSRIELPAELLATGRGVCTEKSLLLASLLDHEGYDAGMWVFDTQYHVTAAVRGTGDGFLRTGYAPIETTRRFYVGELSSQCRSAGPVALPPQLVTASGAGACYQADVETDVIVSALDRATTTAALLSHYHDLVGRASGPERDRYASLAKRQTDASRLARSLELGIADRSRTYALLTRSGGR